MAQYNGWRKVNVSSYDAFRNEVNGNGYDVDGSYGNQCYDGAAVMLYSATGRKLSTGGTGAARGCWEVASARKFNAGTEFELITDKTQIKRGDMVFWTNNSQWGHVGFADENYNGTNYIKVLGENQKGNGSGYPFTIVNLSLNTFLGAFRYKEWIFKEESKPVAKPIVATGITLVALATALGLTVPQLLSGDTDGSLSGLNPEEELTPEEAKDAADAAEKAVEEIKQKTPRELAQERCSKENQECVEVETVKWNGYNSDGTLWTQCKNHSKLDTATCVKKTIEYNSESLEINAAKHGTKQSNGHWIYPGDRYIIPQE